jgi:hypothetical protein
MMPVCSRTIRITATALTLRGSAEFCGAGWSGTRETGDRAVRRERRSVSLRLRVPNREHSSLLTQ